MKITLKYLVNILIVFCFIIFFSPSLFSRELSFLPTYVIGEAPLELKKKDNLQEGISELLGFYAKENFQVELTDSDSLRNFLESMEEETGRKPSKVLINSVCTEFEPDYLVHSEVDFESKGIIYTEVFNCKGKVVYKTESSLESDLYIGMETHAKKLFVFLNPKSRSTAFAYSQPEEEIIFAFDTSGSIAREAGQVMKYMDGILGRTNLKIGLAIINKKNYKLVRPSRNPEQVRNELNKIKFSGELNLEEIGNWLLRITNELNLNPSMQRKFILVTDAKIGKGDGYKFITAIQNLSKTGFQVHILTGSFYDGKDASIYTKASKASGGGLHQILHSQVVGTPKGFYTLYLFDRKLYYEEGQVENANLFKQSEAIAVNDTQVFAQVNFLHPSNMSEVFSKVTSYRIIQQDAIQSNVQILAEKAVNLGSGLSSVKSFSRVLVKVGSSSVWIQLKETSEAWMNKDVSFRVLLRKDDRSSLGFSNVPEESYAYQEPIPLLLNLSISEIKKNLSQSKKGYLECFLSGKVLEIK